MTAVRAGGSSYQWTDYDTKIKAPEAKATQEALKEDKLTGTEIKDLKSAYLKSYKDTFGDTGIKIDQRFFESLSKATGIKADKLKSAESSPVEFTFNIKDNKVDNIIEDQNLDGDSNPLTGKDSEHTVITPEVPKNAPMSKEAALKMAGESVSQANEALNAKPPDFEKFNKIREDVKNSDMPEPAKAKVLAKLDDMAEKKVASMGSGDPVSQNPGMYEIKQGDTVSGMAMKKYTDPKKQLAFIIATQELNPDVDLNKLKPGQTLILPSEADVEKVPDSKIQNWNENQKKHVESEKKSEKVKVTIPIVYGLEERPGKEEWVDPDEGQSAIPATGGV